MKVKRSQKSNSVGQDEPKLAPDKLWEEREQQRRAARRRKSVIICVAVFLLFVITSSILIYIESGSSISPFEVGIWQATLVLNILITMLLVFLIFRNLIKLYFERKQRKLGARLKTKLVVAFVSFSLIPSILLFMLASGLVREMFGKWLVPDVEQVYHKALSIASFYHQQDVNRAQRLAARIAEAISEEGLLSKAKHRSLNELVAAKAREYGLAGVQVIGDGGELARVSSGNISMPGDVFEYDPDRVDGLLKSRKERLLDYSSFGHNQLISCAVPIPSKSGKAQGVVIVKYLVPPKIAAANDFVKSRIMRYRLLSANEAGKQSTYFVLVLILTLLIVFAATWFGFYVAKVMTRPIERLLGGLQAVSRGDLSVHLSGETNDEMGLLVNAFNKMAADLRASRSAVDKAESQLSKSSRDYDRRRRHMEAILSNIGTGVVSLNTKGKITIINEAALAILGLTEDSCVHWDFREVFLAPDLRELGNLIDAIIHSKRNIRERECNVVVKGEIRTLLVTLTVLRDTGGNEMGFVVVFEDLSQLLKAKRSAAWREVARRIAHEIKNPLTPIQLYAQRLQKHLRKVGGDDNGLFKECVDTIIQEVNGLKLLVNEFSRFARMPEVQARPDDIHKVIKEVLPLYEGSAGKAKITLRLDESVPPTYIDAEQMKQVFRNLITNAIEAARDFVNIQIVTSYDPVLKIIRIEVSDDGCGIKQEDKERLFLPYFSRKKQGTGLGLAIVQRIIEDHNGYIRVQDNEPQGTKFIIELPGGASLRAQVPTA